MTNEGHAHPSHAAAAQANSANVGSPRTLIRKSSAKRFDISTQVPSAKGSSSDHKGRVRKLKVTEASQTSPPPTVARQLPKKKGPTAARRRNDRAEESEGEAPHGDLPDTASSSAGLAPGCSEHSTEEGSKRESQNGGNRNSQRGGKRDSQHTDKNSRGEPPDANVSDGETVSGAQLWESLLDSSALPTPKVARYDPLAEYTQAATSEDKQDAADAATAAAAAWGEVGNVATDVATPKPEQSWDSEPVQFEFGRGRGRGAARGAMRGGAGRGRGGIPMPATDVRVSEGDAAWEADHRKATIPPTRPPWGPQAKAAALAAKRGDVQPDTASKASSKAVRTARSPPPPHTPKAPWSAKQGTPGKERQTTGPPSSGPKIRDVVRTSGGAAPRPRPPAGNKAMAKIDLTQQMSNSPFADPLMSWDNPVLLTDPLRVPPASEKVSAWAASQSAMEKPTPGEDPNEIPPSMDSQSNAGSAYLNLSSSISSRWSDDACSDDASDKALKRMEGLTIGGAPGPKRLAPWEAKAARNAVEAGTAPADGQQGFEAMHVFDHSGRRGRGTTRGRARGQNFMTGFVGRGRGLPAAGQTPRAFEALGLPQRLATAEMATPGTPMSTSPAPPDSSRPVSKAPSVEGEGVGPAEGEGTGPHVEEENTGPRAEAQVLAAGDSESAPPQIRLPAASTADSSAQRRAAPQQTQPETQPKGEEETAPQPAVVAQDELVSPPEQPAPPQVQAPPAAVASPAAVAPSTAPAPSIVATPPIYRAAPTISLSSILSQIPPGHAIDAEGAIWDIQSVPAARVGSFIVKEQLEIVPSVPIAGAPPIAATAPASAVAARKIAPHVVQASASAPASAVVSGGQTGRANSRLSTSSAHAVAFRPGSAAATGGAGAGAASSAPTVQGQAAYADTAVHAGWPGYDGEAPSGPIDMGMMQMPHGYPQAAGVYAPEGSQPMLASPMADGTVYYPTAPQGEMVSPQHAYATAVPSAMAYGYVDHHHRQQMQGAGASHQQHQPQQGYGEYGWNPTTPTAAGGDATSGWA